MHPISIIDHSDLIKIQENVKKLTRKAHGGKIDKKMWRQAGPTTTPCRVSENLTLCRGKACLESHFSQFFTVCFPSDGLRALNYVKNFRYSKYELVSMINQY